MFKDSLQEYVNMLEQNPDADFAFSATAIHYSKDSTKNRVHKVSSEQIDILKRDPLSLFFGNLIGAPSTTIYKKNTNKNYDKNLKWLVDIDFYIRMLSDNHNFVYSPRTLIGTVADADHKITNQCADNKNIEIFENYYLFNKISTLIPKKQLKKYLLRLWSITLRHNIKNIEEIRACGYKSDIPSRIPFLFFLNKISSKLTKIYIRSNLL